MSVHILSTNGENLQRVAQALCDGDVAGIPTETVYGLAAAAFHEHALTKVFQVKDRPKFDPLIVHIASAEHTSPDDRHEATDWLALAAAQQVVDASQMEPPARRCFQALTNVFWPGPLTLVVPKHSAVPDLATSGLATVAVRAPRHAAAQALIRAVGQPLAAPSANQFGRISPTTAQAVAAELGDRIEWILDGGSCDIGLESTVAAVLPDGEVSILRPGGISQAALERTLQQPVSILTTGDSRAPLSPGALASHYAPRTPLRLLPAPLDELKPPHRDQIIRLVEESSGRGGGVGLLTMHGAEEHAAHRLQTTLGNETTMSVALTLSLSRRGDWEEAARHLFSSMRRLDDSPDVDVILAEPIQEPRGLAIAVADRLRRAATGG